MAHPSLCLLAWWSVCVAVEFLECLEQKQNKTKLSQALQTGSAGALLQALPVCLQLCQNSCRFSSAWRLPEVKAQHLLKCFMEHTSSPGCVNCLLDSAGSLRALKSPSQLTLSPYIFLPGLFLPSLSLLSIVHPCAIPCPRLLRPILVPLSAFGSSILEASHQAWNASKSGKTKASLCARQVRIHSHNF